MTIAPSPITRPSSRFFAAFHRYLTTNTSTHLHPHPHLLPPHRPHPDLSTSLPPRHRNASTTTTPTSPRPTPSNHYTLFPHTLPRGPPPSGPFSLDLRALRREYLTLQSSAHPDKHPAHLKLRAEATSAAINDAYRTLTSPLKRAVYILSLQGVELGEGMDGIGEEEEEFLEEVMEVRAEIDGAEEEGELVGVRRGNERRVEGCVEGLERGFEALGRVEGGEPTRPEEVERVVKGLVRETVRLRYWIGVQESLDGWEKGRGGGVLLHE